MAAETAPRRGTVLAIASPKGGVGKTTLALNLSYALASRGWETLLVDADPQGCVGLSIDGGLRRRTGLAEVAGGETALAEAAVASRLRQLDLLPVGRVPAVAAAGWAASLEDGHRLAEVFDTARSHYDVTVVDTPPGMTGPALGALREADYVAVALQAEPLAARSIVQVLEVIAALREQGSGPRLGGLVLTMLQSRHEGSLAVAQESWRLFPGHHVFDTAVPRDNVFLEASAAGVPVALLRRRPPAAAAVFDQLAAEIEERLDLIEDDRGRAIPLLDEPSRGDQR